VNICGKGRVWSTGCFSVVGAVSLDIARPPLVCRGSDELLPGRADE
jgi:hypothetical protein